MESTAQRSFTSYLEHRCPLGSGKVVVALLALCGASAGWAQQAASTAAPAGSALEEIVVTAQKRSESLQNVPLSVAALTTEELDRRGITGVASLMQGDIPSLRVEPFAGNQTVLEVGIRGFINPNGSDITNENPVPVYIDDVYYGRQTSIALELNDLERIEVLRGPQGTLFGKNAAGGAVRLISKEPTGQFGLDAKFDAGNYGYKKGIAHIDLPAIGGIAAKIDLLGTNSDGWTTNPAPNQHNYGVTESGAGKLTLLFKPTDTLRVEYAGDYTSIKSTE
jgi:iron complex outermembrane receptor protein